MKGLAIFGFGAVVAGGLVGGLWYRAAGEAQIKADSANARLGRQITAAVDRAQSAEQLLAIADDSLQVLELRLRDTASLPLTPLPASGDTNEIPRLRRSIEERDQVIAGKNQQLIEAAVAVARVNRLILAVRDTVATLRRQLTDSIPAKPCPPPLQPPRIPGVSLALMIVGGPTLSTDLMGKAPRLGWGATLGIGLRIPLRAIF